MLKIKGIDHIVLSTTHSQRMIDFYCNVLGCSIEKTQPAQSLTHLRAGNCLIDIVEITQPVDQSGWNLERFCLCIDAFDYELLKDYFSKNNIEIYNYDKRYGAQGYSESFYLKDPEGNEIELVALK